MALKAKMGEFLSDIKTITSMPVFTLSPSKPSSNKVVGAETKKDDKMKTMFLETWNNIRYDMGSEMSLKKDSSVWILGVCHHAKPSGESTEEDETARSTQARSVLLDFSSRPWFTYRKQFPPISGTNITSDTGWGCMLRSVQMMIAEGLMLHFLGRKWRWFGNNKQHDKYLHNLILGWFIDDPCIMCPLSIHRLSEIGRRFGTTPGNWYGPNTVAYIVQEAVEKAKEAIPEIREVSIYIAQDCTVYSEDVYDLCGWSKGHLSSQESHRDVKSHPPAENSHLKENDTYSLSSTSSATSEYWEESDILDDRRSSEMSSFCIPVISLEDSIPSRKIENNTIQMTEFFNYTDYKLDGSTENIYRDPTVGGSILDPRESSSVKLQEGKVNDINISALSPSSENFTSPANSNTPRLSYEYPHGLLGPRFATEPNAINSNVLPNSSKASGCSYDPQKILPGNDVKKKDVVIETLSRSSERKTHLASENPTIAVSSPGDALNPSGFDLDQNKPENEDPDSFPPGFMPQVQYLDSQDSTKFVSTRLEKSDVLPPPVFQGLDSKDNRNEEHLYPYSMDEDSQTLPSNEKQKNLDADVDFPPRRESFKSPPSHPTAAIILIPVRLGESTLNPIYIPCIQEMLSLQFSLGIIGGKPKHSLFFVGYQDEALLHLDPHYCQVADTLVGYRKNLHNYHTMSIRKTSMKKIDPSCCFGFYCENAEEFEQFKIDARNSFTSAKNQMSYPMCLILDGRSDDHKICEDPPSNDSASSGENARASSHKEADIGSESNDVPKPTSSINCTDDDFSSDTATFNPNPESKHSAVSKTKGGKRQKKSGSNSRTGNEEKGSRLKTLLPDASKLYSKFIKSKPNSPLAKRKDRESLESLEKEFELL